MSQKKQRTAAPIWKIANDLVLFIAYRFLGEKKLKRPIMICVSHFEKTKKKQYGGVLWFEYGMLLSGISVTEYLNHDI